MGKNLSVGSADVSGAGTRDEPLKNIAKRTVRIFSVSSQSRSPFSGSLQAFCLTVRAYLNTPFFFYKNVGFPAQAEYSYFSADFRLKIFLYYS